VTDLVALTDSLVNQPSLRPPALILLAEVVVLGLAERQVSPRLAVHRWLGTLLILPGTVIHELAHALAVLVLGGRIDRFVPFWPIRQADGTVLFGQVLFHGFDDPLRRALVALAPLLLVPPALSGLTLLTLGTLAPAEILTALGQAPLPVALVWSSAMLLLSRGAFPSIGDPIGLVGALLVLILGLGLLLGTAALAGPIGVLALLNLLASIFALPALMALVTLLAALIGLL
jgi:hypothetical protein